MKYLAALFFGVLSLFAPQSQAAMSDWVEVQGGAVRLIASGMSDDGTYLAGLEFLLEPGWHTYWRYPGEAGIPPMITLNGESENLAAFEVLYPAPKRYFDGFSNSIVYHDGVVLPLSLKPIDKLKHVLVSVDVFFGVCKDICVPGEATLNLSLNSQAKKDNLADKLIQRDLARIPTQKKYNDLKITSVALKPGADVLVIQAVAPTSSKVDLFAAGPEGSYIGLPKLVQGRDGMVEWTLSTRGLAITGDNDDLLFVLASESRAVEQRFKIENKWLNLKP